MLGEQIGDGIGKILSQRVIDVRDGIPKIEVSFTSSGKFKGIEATELATYSTTPRSDGVLYGEGRGVVLSKDGKETVTWTGQGIGRFVSQGRIRFAGSLFYRTSSSGQLGFPNNLVGVFEYESDEQGNSFSRIWEWK
jgi:hypothetical protein